MKKPIALIPVLCFSYAFIFAQNQLDDFDIARYKLPDITRHQLDLQTNALSNFSKQNYNSNNSEDRNSNNYGVFSLKYQFYRNSKRYQGVTNAGISGDAMFKYYKNKDIDNSVPPGGVVTITEKNRTFSENFFLESENRFYFHSLFYLESDINVAVSLKEQHIDNNQKNTLSNETETTITKYFTSNYQFEIPVSIGYGRIERVEDARQAIFILKDLQRLGRLKRVPDPNEIFAMAEKISEVKNKRFFDSRLQLIDELDTVNAFLTNHDLLTETDISYFTSLNDM